MRLRSIRSQTAWSPRGQRLLSYSQPLPAADPADVMLRMILGSCDASELQGLDAIRKIGAKTKGVESVAIIASEGTVTLIEICSGAVDCGAMAMDQRWGVGISGGSVERGNLTPDREALIYFGSPLGRAEPMPSWSKVRGDGAKGRQEPLGMPHRFKAFHRPFALSGALMRVLGAIVEIPRLPVGHRPHELAVSNPVAGQFVGHQHPRHIRRPLSSLRKNRLAALAFRRDCTKHVQDVAVLVDATPQVTGDAVDLHEDLVEVPLVAGAGAPPAQLVGVGLPNLAHQRRIVS